MKPAGDDQIYTITLDTKIFVARGVPRSLTR